jgi:hypothetical protein
MMKLSKHIFAVGIHGKTDQQIDEGTLPAGTQVRDVREHPTMTGMAWRFEARDGNYWFTHQC